MSSSAAAAYRLEGPVSFANMAALRAAGEEAIAAADGDPVIDLAGLENGNSVALALLMAWFRTAAHLGKSILFVEAPDELRSIIDLSGMTDVLPLGAAADQPAEAVT